MQYVLGVDGGNSKTIALIASLDGAFWGLVAQDALTSMPDSMWHCSLSTMR